jgi:hypothetical protein
LNALQQAQLTFKLYGYQYGPAKRHIKRILFYPIKKETMPFWRSFTRGFSGNVVNVINLGTGVFSVEAAFQPRLNDFE